MLGQLLNLAFFLQFSRGFVNVVCRLLGLDLGGLRGTL
jgi:hypothetical protein